MTKEQVYNKAYFQANKKHINEHKKAYRFTHKKSTSEQNGRFYQKHKEEIVAYYQANSDNFKLRNKKRRALKLGVNHEPYSNNYVFERDNWICGICGRKINKRLKHPNPLSPSVDHIIPLTKGGNDSLINVQAAHLRCNLGKHNKNNSQLRLIG